MSVSVTKDQYFEMCEMLGEDPVEENVPVEFEDLPLEVQHSLIVYNLMQDMWEGFSGTYMGKNLIGLTELFNLCKIDEEDRQFTIGIIKIIDKIRSKELNRKQNEKPATE